jgi:SpoU rRNA methylase family enzyme
MATINDLPVEVIDIITLIADAKGSVSALVCHLWRNIVRRRLVGDDMFLFLEKEVDLLEAAYAVIAVVEGHKDIVNDWLELASGAGRIAHMRQCAEWGATIFQTALESAAYYNQIEAMFECRRLGTIEATIDHQTNADMVSECGIVEMSDLFDLECVCASAASKGHVEAMLACKLWGLQNFDGSMISAAAEGHVRAFVACYIWGARMLTPSFEQAAQSGHTTIMRLCYHLAIDPPDPLHEIACFDGVVYEFDLVISKSFVRAAAYGHVPAMRLCQQLGQQLGDDATFISPTVDSLEVLNEALLAATANGFEDAVRECIALGANCIVEAFQDARAERYDELADLILTLASTIRHALV